MWKFILFNLIYLRGNSCFDFLAMEQFYEYKWILKVLDRLMDTWTKGKWNLISCLIHRAYKISSSYRLFHLDLSYLRKYFLGNLYPHYLFNLSIRKCLTLNCLSNQHKKMPVSITLPYLGPLITKLSKDFNVIKKTFTLKFIFAVCSIINVQLVHISPLKIKSLLWCHQISLP